MTRWTRPTAEALVVLWAATGVAAMLVLPFRSAVRGWLHLRLAAHADATLADAASIFVHNATVAALPLGCALAEPASRVVGRVADAAVVTILGLNAAMAGSAIGAYGPAIARYLPHLPCEWFALVLACGAWRATRALPALRSQGLGWIAGATFALLALAALFETYATPHV